MPVRSNGHPTSSAGRTVGAVSGSVASCRSEVNERVAGIELRSVLPGSEPQARRQPSLRGRIRPRRRWLAARTYIPRERSELDAPAALDVWPHRPASAGQLRGNLAPTGSRRGREGRPCQPSEVMPASGLITGDDRSSCSRSDGTAPEQIRQRRHQQARCWARNPANALTGSRHQVDILKHQRLTFGAPPPPCPRHEPSTAGADRILATAITGAPAALPVTLAREDSSSHNGW